MIFKWMFSVGFIFLVSCASKERIAQTINENPEIMFDAIKKNPSQFMEAVQIAAQTAQKDAYANQEKQAQLSLEKDLKNPRKVAVDSKKLLVGDVKAPITIIKYADFQCPACRMGYASLEKIKEKYKGKIQFVHKNVPLSFHKLAPLAAQIYEALLIIDKTKALAFYKKTYEEQGKWVSEKDLWAIAKAIGGNKKQIQELVAKGDIDKGIAADVEEHAQQGFEGTPAYIVNGVGMYGAQSEKEFAAVIEKTMK